MKGNKVQLFENKRVRSVWNEEKEEWFFSVIDVVAVLTDSVNPTDYLKKMRKRDNILGDYLGTNCPQVEMMTETGKIKTRKELADEWNKSGVRNDFEYAILTNLMSKEWSGKSVADYKKFKNLKKESLRDNMTSLELVLNMLAEATTSEIHKNENVSGFEQTKTVAKRGASVAKTARIAAEEQTGKPVVSSKNAKLLGNIEHIIKK